MAESWRDTTMWTTTTTITPSAILKCGVFLHNRTDSCQAAADLVGFLGGFPLAENR
jgi:hypothetical protein